MMPAGRDIPGQKTTRRRTRRAMAAARTQGLRACLVLWLLGCLAGTSAAGEGTAGADFLRVITGARTAALGGAYTALGDDAESLLSNPAGMLELVNPQVALSHLSWWEDITFDSLWGVQPLGGDSALGLTAAFLNVPPFDSTGQADAVQESAWNLMAGAAYARRLLRPLTVGLLAKYVASQLGPARSWALAVDVGARYSLLNDQLVVGASCQNLGYLQAYVDSGDPLPLTAALGAAYSFWPDEPFRLSLAADLRVPLQGARASLAAGAEAWFWNLIALRVGTRSGSDVGDWLSVGLGVRWQRFHLDYAIGPVGLLGTTHYLSAAYDFGRQARLPRPKLNVRITTKQLVDSQGKMGYEVDFIPEAQVPAGLERWEMTISTRAGQVICTLSGQAPLPVLIPWNGCDRQGKPIDRESYYTFHFLIQDRMGYSASASGEILPLSIMQLPKLKVLPRDLYAGQVSFAPKQDQTIREWSLAIVNPEGKILRKYHGLGAMPKDFSWDGTDVQNRPVAVQEGFYFILDLKDQAGNEVKTVAPLAQIDAGTKASTVVGVPIPERIPFAIRLPKDVHIQSWALDIINTENGKVVRNYAGEGNPPEDLQWDARDEQGKIVRSSQKFSYVLRLQDRLGNIWRQAAPLGTTEINVLAASADYLRIKIEQILFDFNKAELKPEMFEKLRKIVDLVEQPSPDKVKILIEGHTDEIGSDEYNYELSLNRARMVMRYLVEEEGLPSTLMEIKGYGKEFPLEKGDGAEARAKNRRVEITLVLKP